MAKDRHEGSPQEGEDLGTERRGDQEAAEAVSTAEGRQGIEAQICGAQNYPGTGEFSFNHWTVFHEYRHAT